MSSDRPHLDEAVDLTLRHALERPPTLGTGRLVCVDGPAGSGKTTLADALVVAARRRVTSVGLVHLDDLYQGWSGLGAEVTTRIEDGILRPLAEGGLVRYRRWDWFIDDWAEEHLVDPVALLVLEGVGSAARAYDDLVTTRAWVSAPRELRLRRGLARGDVGVIEQWERWLDDEARLLASERTRERADVIVDGTGGEPPRLV